MQQGTEPNPQAPRPARFGQSMLCFGGIIAIISSGLFAFAIDLHSLLFLCLIWAGAHAGLIGYPALEIRQLMSQAISRALPAIYIFMLIGLVIASFIQSGTIATLMYFGLDWLSPALFLPVGLILCALMSLATGTSWGTAGTLGVVFIGIGSALSVPLPLVAGMVVCGATFGDKMSPVSDTTNLAAMSSGTDLYRHIYAMLFTTVPTFVLTLIIFSVLGWQAGAGILPATQLGDIRIALAADYHLQPILTLLPIAVLFVLSMRRVPAEITMTASVLTAVAIACVYQGQGLAPVLNSLWQNTPGNTGIVELDALLGRGGLASMSWTLLLAIQALALGGILHGAGFLASLLNGLIAKLQHTAALIAATIASGFIGNMAMGEAYISIILNCQLFAEKFSAQGLDKAVLSRSVEEGATMTTALIPWTTAGAFYAATLGVPVLDYLPFAFFNYLNGPIAVIMAGLGIGLLRSKQKA